MRNIQTLSLARLALIALTISSFTVPLIAASTSASAATAGTAGAASGGGTAGAAGAGAGTGGAGAGGGGGGAGCGNCSLARIDPDRGPRHQVAVYKARLSGSCYKNDPIFDRWGNNIGGLPREECY